MPVSESTYLQVVLEDPEGHWELCCGELRSKPPMTAEHGDLCGELGFMLRRQLPRNQFRIRYNHGQVRRTASTYYVPDLIVVPAGIEGQQRGTRLPEAYREPLPLIVEVWSPSTGDYDVTDKLPEYQRRGDQEIWLLHPYDRTLTAWVRGPDSGYRETISRGGIVRPAFLGDVSIDLDELFAG